MDNIHPTRVAGPGDIAEEEAQVTGEGTFFDARVAPDVLDRARLEARTATYPNSAAEAAYIRAVDEAVFDRVREYERLSLIPGAQKELARGAERTSEAVGLMDDLDAIRDELRQGGNTADLAKRYNTLRLKANRLTTVLSGLSKNADTSRAKLADPVAAAQKVLSIMPLRTFRPIDPTPYLDR